MDFLDARNFLPDRPAGQFMNQFAEGRIFLRRSPDDRKRIDGLLLGIDFMHSHDGKRMDQAVIAQMISKRSLGLGFAGMDFSRNDKIRIVADAVTIHIAVPEMSSRQQSGKSKLAHAFRQRHNR